jgi:hypothetical protein
MFVEGISRYHQYAQNQSVLTVLFGLIIGRILGVICVSACAACIWKMRGESASQAAFGRCFALVLALTVLIVPMSALYNQVLLAPAILALVKSAWDKDPFLPAIQRARIVGAFLIAWPWIATLGLSLLFVWLTPRWLERVWAAPLYSSLVIPVFVFGLALLDTWGSQARTLRDSAPAE